MTRKRAEIVYEKGHKNLVHIKDQENWNIAHKYTWQLTSDCQQPHAQEVNKLIKQITTIQYMLLYTAFWNEYFQSFFSYYLF